jgi:hypothetical protein
MKIFTCVIVIGDDKIQSTKRCELLTFIITVHGSSLLGDCIYNLDSLMGVIPLLVFPHCGYDEMMMEMHRNK